MKKMLLVLLLSTAVYSAEVPVAYEYLVFASSLTKFNINIDDWKIGRLDNVGGHWEFSTKIYGNLDCGCSTNYYLVWITTTTRQMNTFLNGTNIKKCYYKTRRRSVWGDAQGRHDVIETLRPYPNDLYIVHKTSSW